MVLPCIVLNNEHPSSFFDVTEGEVNVETYELFDVKMLPFMESLWCPLLYSILAYWLIMYTCNTKSMQTPSFNQLFSISDMLGDISSLFVVESMKLWLFYSYTVGLFI